MDFIRLYTRSELDLMVIRHEEGRVTLPAKMLREVKAEIISRARLARIDDAIAEAAGWPTSKRGVVA